jgi:protein gp37
MADVFEEHADVEDARQRLWQVIEATPALDWLLLTKRPENVLPMIPESWRERLPMNIWMMTSVENQQQAERRIPLLLAIPAQIRALSVEPLLGAVDLRAWLPRIDWVIVGGESGAQARPLHPTWVRTIRDDCLAAQVAFFFKQWGAFVPDEQGEAVEFARVGKKAAGRVLDGQTWDAIPRLCETPASYPA